MARFLLELIGFVALQLALFGTFVGVYYKPDPNGFMAVTIDKHNLLRNQPSPRLILIGGSNLALGIDSSMLAEQLPYHPVNMGIFAGFHADFLLREVEDQLRPGDVVVVMLEYEHFQPHWAKIVNSPRDLALLVEARPETLRNFRWPQVKDVLDQGLVGYGGGVFRQAWTQLWGEDPGDPGVYQRKAFNEWCDVTIHWDWKAPAEEGEATFMIPTDQGIPNNIPLAKGFREETLDALNAFYDRCHTREVAVFYAYPPFPRFTFADLTGSAMGMALVTRRADDYLGDLHAVLEKRLRIPIITDPGLALIPMEYCFDSNYHLQRLGARYKTQMLIDALRKELGLKVPKPKKKK